MRPENLYRVVGTIVCLLMCASGVPSLAADDDAVTSPLALALGTAAINDSSASDYRYRLDYQSLTIKVHAEVDPRAPDGERLEILDSELAESEKAERLDTVIADIERGAAQGYWCSALLKSVPADASLLSHAAQLATYEFDPIPTGDRNDDFLENLVGEVSIDPQSGVVRSFRLRAPKPFRQALIARITEFELNTECQPAPDGRYFASDFRMHIRGSAAFRDFEDEVVRRLTILRTPGQ